MGFKIEPAGGQSVGGAAVIAFGLPLPAVGGFLQRNGDILEGQGNIVRGILEAVIAEAGEKNILHHGVLSGPVVHGGNGTVI